MLGKICIVISSLFLLLSCQPKEKMIQLIVTSIDDESSISKGDEAILKERFIALTQEDGSIKTERNDNELIFKINNYQDTSAIRQVVERSRMLKLVQAIPSADNEEVRKFFANDIIEKPKKNKPYKAGAVAGLVSVENEKEFYQQISSPEFKSAFPQVESYFNGVKPMEDKLAFFLEKKGSAYIDENMFSKIEKYKGEDPEEGIFYLELKDEFADRLGPLTGNDSTYLLHVLDNEVYISKIIEPYIEGPVFSMSGAFTPKQVEIFSALWNSEDLSTDLEVESIKILD